MDHNLINLLFINEKGMLHVCNKATEYLVTTFLDIHSENS